jgi:Matrixin
MRKGKCAAIGVAAVISMLGAAAPAMAAKVVAVEGVSKSDPSKQVEILVVVGKDESEKAAKERALKSQGAKAKPEPPQSNGYSFTGLRWDILPVKQYYNPLGQPTTAAQNALTGTHPTWSNVTGSTYKIGFSGTTNRCPSIVRECPGPQRIDGNNDVGWAQLQNGTLGVTWSTSNPDEADMAINTRYTWTTGCRQQGSAFDLQTVFLHENGHVAGLGHSNDISAVMYPSYQAAHCTLAADDRAGIAALY